MLISIEGIDFSGKSTLTKILRDRLMELKPKYGNKDSVICSNHYDQPLADIWRKLFINEEYPNTYIEDFFLSIYGHSKGFRYKLKDLLDNGNHVIMDRYLGSMIAMQALINNDNKLLNIMTQCMDLIGFPRPDLYVILKSNENTFFERRSKLEKNNDDQSLLDKFEKRSWLSYHFPLQNHFITASKLLNSREVLILDADLDTESQVDLTIKQLDKIF